MEEQEKTPFSEWFNINDKGHLSGLASYIRYGGKFLPADVEVSDLEIEVVKNNIMHAWIDQHCLVTYRNGERPLHE